MKDTSFFGQIRSLGVERNADAPIGGVSSGLARKWNVDPLLVRAGFIALTFAGGAGAMLYALAWAFLPDERTGQIHAQEVTRGNVTGGLVGAAALLLTAIVVFTGLSFTSTLGLIVTVIIGAVCYNAFRRNREIDNHDDVTPPTTVMPATETTSGRAENYPSQENLQKNRERDEARHQREEMRARRRLSGRSVAAVLAVALLSIAGFLLLLEVTDSSVHQLPATIAFTSLALGAIVLVIGIFGRRGGVLSFFALIAAMLAVPVMLINTTVYSNETTMSDKSWKPTSVSDIGTGYSVTMGTSKVDFSNLDVGDSTEPINVSASMADLHLQFAEDQKVAINTNIRMSSIQTELPYTDGGDPPFELYYETDPEWGDDVDTDEWEERWEDHSNTYAYRDSFEGSDSRTIFLGGITNVNDADIVIDLQSSMSSITIRQQVAGYPDDDASSTATPEPTTTPGE